MQVSAYFWVLGTISAMFATTWLTAWLWISKRLTLVCARWIWRGIRKVRPNRVPGSARWGVYIVELVAKTGWKVYLAPYLALLFFLVGPLAIGIGSIYLTAALVAPVP